MLSRLFSAARNILISQPQNQESVLESTPAEVPDSAMVTTRRQSGQKERTSSPIEDDVPKELLNKESRKRRRILEKENGVDSKKTLGSAGKRAKTVTNMDGGDKQPFESHTHSVTQMSVASLAQEGQGENHVELEQDESQTKSEVEAAANPLEVKMQSKASTTKKSATKHSPKTKPTTNGTSTTSIPSPSITKPKHKRFGSEEPIEEPVQELRPREEVADSNDESSDDDDDDAPEEVAADVAEEDARRIAQDAARAVKMQEAAVRQKRIEKDEKRRKELQTASNKRKVTEDVPSADASLKESADDESAQDVQKLAAGSAPKRFKLDRKNLPAFLPEEYLSDTEEVVNLPLSTHVKSSSGPNKIKFLDEQKPKDIKVGRTTFRVVEKSLSGAVLAPKAEKVARNTKETWLQGRKLQDGGIRKKSGGEGGFFVDGDKKRRKRK